MSPHDDHVGAWCAVIASRIIGPVFVRATHLHKCYTLSDTVMNRCPVTRESVPPFQQESATDHTANNFERCVESVFGERMISLVLQPLRLPDLNP
jgi:hypothetical protein